MEDKTFIDTFVFIYFQTKYREAYDRNNNEETCQD